MMFCNGEYFISQSIENISNWKKLQGKSVLISGATGMIGSYLISFFLQMNRRLELNMQVYGLGRKRKRAELCLMKAFFHDSFQFIEQDVNRPLEATISCDFLIHAASNTHPLQYSTDPVGTMTSNFIGTKNLLDYAVAHNAKRFVFLSSVEVYGENRGDVESFDESYLGYIDCNTLRAGYPESKRSGEALCQAYRSAYGVETIVVRLSRVYGPTMRWSDSKAIAQFIKKAVQREDIVLKSNGKQLFSYCHAIDAARAIIFLLLQGTDGEAYNVASKNSDVTLRELAQLCAELGDSKIVFNLPEIQEAQGYSTVNKALLDTRKLQALGWESLYDIRKGLRETVEYLRRNRSNGEN